MTWLGVLIVAIGAIIVYMIVRVPRHVLKFLGKAEEQKQRIAELDAHLARLSAMRVQARLVFETALARGGSALEQEDLDTLVKMGATCEKQLADIGGKSPILERYLQNHLAVLSFVVNAHDNNSGLAEALKAALQDLDRSQAAEQSTHPVAVLERRVATGRGAV